jgi:HK97 gp10 family phage protein
MGDVTVHVSGFAELGRALDELEKASTVRSLIQRVLKKAGQPVAEHASDLAPIGPQRHGKGTHKAGRLKTSFTVGTSLSKTQKRLEKNRDTTSFTQVYIGAGPFVEAITEEFGTARGVKPHPMLRPAWDGGKERVLESIKNDMGAEIEKTAARVARRAAAKLEKLA